MEQNHRSRKFSIFSNILWALSLIAIAIPLIQLAIACLEVIMSNWFDWRPLTLSIPPVENTDSNSALDGLFVLISVVGFSLLLACSLLYAILVHQSSRASLLRAGLPLVLNLATLLLITASTDWAAHLDLQTNGKRHAVVQMIEQSTVNAAIVQSFTLYQGTLLLSHSRDLSGKEKVMLPSQDFRVLIHLSPAYQHLALLRESVEAIRQREVTAIYFPVSSSSWFGTRFTGWLYQSNDAQPKTFGEKNFDAVRRLQDHWYEVDDQQSFN